VKVRARRCGEGTGERLDSRLRQTENDTREKFVGTRFYEDAGGNSAAFFRCRKSTPGNLGLSFEFWQKGVKCNMWGYPLDIHKMSGVLFAKVVRPRKRSSLAKAGRGDRPGMQLGPGSFDDSSSGFGAGFVKRQ
jgi:hypothetical protein